jgi:hypothetical protein
VLLETKQRQELLEHAKSQLLVQTVLAASSENGDVKPLQRLNESVFKLTFPEEAKPKLLEKSDFEKKISKLSKLPKKINGPKPRL